MCFVSHTKLSYHLLSQDFFFSKTWKKNQDNKMLHLLGDISILKVMRCRIFFHSVNVVMTSLRIKPHLIALSCWGHFARERHLHFNLKNSMYNTRKVTWLQAAKDLLCTGVLTRQAREPITWNSLCRQQSELCVKNLNWSVDFEMWKNMSKRQ